MNNRSFSGESLEKALREGGLASSQTHLLGMVKQSEKKGHISFTSSGCETWVDIPVGIIERAEQIGQRACRDHSHPIMEITLKEPKDPEGRTLLALLAQAVSSQLAEMQAGAFGEAQIQDGDLPMQAFLDDGVEERSAAFGASLGGATSPGMSGFGGTLNAWGCWDSWCKDYATLCRDRYGRWRRCWVYKKCQRCIWPW